MPHAEEQGPVRPGPRGGGGGPTLDQVAEEATGPGFTGLLAGGAGPVPMLSETGSGAPERHLRRNCV